MISTETNADAVLYFEPLCLTPLSCSKYIIFISEEPNKVSACSQCIVTHY